MATKHDTDRRGTSASVSMPNKQPQPRPVTERALIGRLRRKLAHENEYLTIARPGSRLEAGLGRYIICDGHNGNPQNWGGPEALVAWARELGVMHSDEVLDGEDERSERQREREQARQLLEGRLVPIDRTETRTSVERMLRAKPTVVTHVEGKK